MIFLLAMLIFLYHVIRWDVSVTTSTLKVFMNFWDICFKFWLRLCKSYVSQYLTAIKFIKNDKYYMLKSKIAIFYSAGITFSISSPSESAHTFINDDEIGLKKLQDQLAVFYWDYSLFPSEFDNLDQKHNEADLEKELISYMLNNTNILMKLYKNITISAQVLCTS